MCAATVQTRARAAVGLVFEKWRERKVGAFMSTSSSNDLKHKRCQVWRLRSRVHKRRIGLRLRQATYDYTADSLNLRFREDSQRDVAGNVLEQGLDCLVGIVSDLLKRKGLPVAHLDQT